ncbi:MAG: glucose 1-dehydrogenase [Thermoleophilia bacterium]|nr:glucose 1-dehydrogenase [Thermoleophilia bacterium]
MERVALVTGASTGIGLAVAERLVADGFALAFATHSESDEARQAFERVSARGRAHWLVGDLEDPAVPDGLVQEAVGELGRLDVLVNNAGLTSAKPALELTADDFDRIFTVDVRAAFLLARAAVQPMREAGAGSIVNVTSVHAHVPRPGFALYAAAKAALGMLTRGLALELAADGIRVNAVAPGAIATERNEEAEELVDEIPLGRAGTPQEVAALVAFLAGDESRYVTGSSYVIDGGMAQHVVPPAW